MLFNELAQWAVLIVLAVCVLGLLRQLGQFIIPRKEQLLGLGPELESLLPDGLLEGDELRAQIKTRVEATTGFGLLAVMNEGCLGCRALFEELKQFGRPTDGPMVALLEGGDAELRSGLGSYFDVVIDDPGGKRAKAAGIIASPFVLVFDNELRIRHRMITGALADFVASIAVDGHSDEAAGASLHVSPAHY